jgi:hypothetical protein
MWELWVLWMKLQTRHESGTVYDPRATRVAAKEDLDTVDYQLECTERTDVSTYR